MTISNLLEEAGTSFGALGGFPGACLGMYYCAIDE